MNNDFIVFGRPRLSEEHCEEVSKTLRSGWIGRGPKVSQFEKEFSSFTQIPNCAAVSSCTAALHLACLSIGLQEGDEVIVPAMTFAATAHAVIHAGATPILVDCLPNSPCIDPKEVEKKISKKTKAIIPVHMHGERANMDALSKLAKEKNIFLIEDAAHSLELPDLGKKSDLVCFSFYPTKNITTIEGGIVASYHSELIEKSQVLAQMGLSRDAWKRFSDAGFKHYLIEELGFKYNFTDVQASLGLVELKHIRSYEKRRKEIWNFYQESLSDTGLTLPPHTNSDHALHLFAPRVSEKIFSINRDQFVSELHGQGIGCGIHYLSICEHPYYQRTFGLKADSCPQAYLFGRETFSIPFSQYLTDQEVNRIMDTVRSTCKKFVRRKN